ncbi:YadA-like family protein [Haemophilus parainfluenzae]|uniref:YadA-like family protein n=2 Tax=Pseudomonadota TaxID=1224 RepID=UPI00195D179A|nr:YadA-like family protein [Haemophilus parainfluenzae]VTX50764.1 Autotransporter adhesin NhhA [Haemophilus parainfluenzae]
MNKIFRIVWSQATQSWVVVSELTKAHKKQSSSNSQGSAVKFSGNFIKSSAIALSLLSGHSAYAALNQPGTGSDNAVALGEAANANQARAVAIGKGATISSGQDTIAIGTDTKAKGHTSIVIGKNAKTTNDAEGTVVIGRDAFSEGSGNGARPNTVVGRGAYTAFGENGTYRLNAATALGFQAGAGLRTDPNNGNKLIDNQTNADNNAEVLVKAGYGLDENAPADTKAALQGGNLNNNLTFYRKKHINEATAIGAEARAIGDQSIAIGGQVVAGDGVVALGGNDTDQLRNNKYQVVTDDALNRTKVETIDDYNLAYTESTRTVAGQYKNLVGRDMPTAYKSTYGQSGSVVIGMEAHSTTALGTAIGTNSVVRMGAFGATAIGAGSTVQPNADAAVAIGMGSVANGAYSLAAGTASWAEYGDIALGYQAKASGKDGAIAMGRATNAQGDSSIMIGGANIASAAAQNTSYEKSNGQTITKSVTEKINGKDVTREYSFAGTTKTNGSVADAYKELTGITMDTTALDFAKNKNGHASTSLGVHALSKGDLGTAIGAGSRSDAIGSVALGVGAHATKQNAVAIGTGSTTDLVGTRQLSVNYDSDGNIVSDNSKDIAYTFKWAGGTNTAEGDVVSFGSSGAERQLKNVAAGRVAEDSTDAINGSQLNSITKKIAAGFNTSGNEVAGSSGVFTSKKANADSAKKDYETAIRSDDKVQLQVGNNLKLDRDETVSEVEVPDDFNKNQKVKKKIRKADFAYSLNPVLTNLTSAEFKGTDANAPITKLTNAGVTITPATSTGKKPVSLTENGLNNGGNPITNVAGNLDGAKTGTNAPTNKADKPNNVDDIKNNAATVGDVLNAGWNLQEKGTAKDFVTAYDTVNFVDGDGTSVSVENTDGKTSKIKYSANLGDGLEKDATTNKIKVKAADNTLTTDDKGLKVNTGNITASSVPTVTDADKDKIATVGNVAEAIKAAAWKATSAATTSGENTGKKDQEVKAGDTVTFEADKNIKIAQADGKFTFSTKDNVEFTTVKVGDTANGKKPVELKNGDVITANNNPEQPTTALNVSSDGKPTQITGVGSVLNTTPVTTTPDGSAPTTQPNVVNLGTAHGQTPLSPNVLNSAATVRDLANMGWKVSSDKATGAEDKSYNDVVRNADEVKFVGKNAAKVSGKTENGVRTITVDVEVPDTKTAELVSSKDGSVIAPSTNPELQKALKDAKDALAALPKEATPEQKEAAENKVKAAETALNNAVDNKGVATAKNVADMINASGFTLKTSNVEGGEKDATSTGDEVINPGKAVEMIAGKNLTVKQEANGKVTYSTKDDVEFNTVKLGDAKDGKAPVNMKTEAAKPATNNGADQPTTALNFTSGEGDNAKPTQLTGVGSTLNVKPVDTNPNGTATTGDARPNLVDLVGTKDAPVNKNAAATVGDLQNMGWVVSTKDGNGYTDVVKNANQVDFKGTGLATVTGETDKDGIRTITVNVDAQKTVEAAQTPVVYTNKDGDKLVKVGDKFYKADDVVNGKPKDNAQEVPKGDVIASMNNGDNKTNKPMQLANIGSNLPTVNDTNKQAFDPNSTTPKAGKDNKSAPITAKEAADIVNNAGNNAATVSDVLNAGWNLQNNGEARDFVKPYDTVNFINGKGTVAVVETADDAASSTVKFDVDAGEITSNTNGSVNGPTTAENAKKLADDLKKAEQAVKDLPADATEDKKAEAQKALKDAQDAAAPLNKVATAQNVADMINASGFTLKTSNVDGGEKVSGDDEVINPGKAVEMIAGKNLTVKQEANGKVTYATKDDVSFNTVNVGDNTYVDADGKPVTKNADGTYTDSKGQPIEEGKVTKLAPVAMKAEKAKPATNNGNKAEDQPTTALNVSSSDGKPTQITGVGSTLNVKPVDTNPNGTPTTGDARPNLVDLVGTKDAPVNKNAAATVGDLQNMGWVVSTKDGNGYKDVVKNANQVDFTGGAGISVKGTTTTDGVREITISVKDGEVIKPNQFTAKVSGTDTPVTKVGDQYYNTADIDPKTGKPNAKANPVTPDAGTTPTNAGDGYVTGNKVATAIQKSGFVVGKQTEKLSAADFNDKDEKVNPDDELRFADGNNTKVKLATKESVDKDGNKVTTTTVKVDVTGLPVQYTDKNGTPVTKVGDKYFTVDDKGNPTATEVKPADLTTNMVNPAAAPNVIGAPTTLGNVKSNLPSVNDADKNAKDVAGNPIAGKDNKSAPIDAAKAADIAKNVGNNAATISDVLNAGWNLQNNGEAKDFVKPYDTVNFVDGKGTKVVVKTEEDGTTSNVKFDIDTGKITNNADGSVQGPVTPEMQKALEDATNALNSLPPTAPAAVIDAAKKAVADAANNIANVANKVATAQDVANAINKSGFTLTTSANGGEKISGKPEMINPGKKVEMVAGKNMTVKQESNGKVTYATASNVTFDSVQFGDKGPKITNKAGNINVSGPDGKTPTKITGVAPGEISATSKDAINGSQLHAVASNLNNKINKVGKHADAGTASALAAANIPQAYTPGKSLVGIAAGNYQGQNGLAVGMSRISDNGKIIIRLSGTANSQGKTGVAAGVGYQW